MYFWRVYNPLNQNGTSGGGEITDSGRVPALTIHQQYAGYIVELSVDAKDQFGRSGGGEKITSRVETFEYVNLNPSSVFFNFGDTHSVPIEAIAQYSAGGNYKVTGLGTWSSNDADVLVTPDGKVSLSPNNQRAFQTTINFTYQGVIQPLPVTISANNPKILGLDFDDDARINTSIGATYTISHEGAPNTLDQSYYIWKYADNMNSNTYTILKEGRIITSGKVSESPNIDIELQGKVLALEIYPMNNQLLQGENKTIKTEIESLSSMNITPALLEIENSDAGEDQNKHQLKVLATFTKGSEIDVTKLGNWQSDNPLILVDQTGMLSISSEAGAEDITGKVTFTYLGKSSISEVRIKSQERFTLSLELLKDNAIANNETNTISATVVNQLGQPVENIRVYFSSAISGVLPSPSSALTDKSGKVSVSVSKNNTTGGRFNINATVQNNSNIAEQSISVNFLTQVDVDRIIAPKDKVFGPNQKFPTTGYPNATFNIVANNGIPNASLTWSSSDNNAATVDNNGNVTLYESSLNKDIQITARDNQTAYIYPFKVNNWFIRLPNTWTYDNALIECNAQGMTIASRNQLSSGKNIRGVGSLWSEWNQPNGWSQAINSHYWSSTESTFRNVYVIDIEDGDYNTIKGNDGAYREYGVCVK